MIHQLNIPGFEGQQISAEVSGMGSSRLFVNGQAAPSAPKRGQYLLYRNDGSQVTAYFKGAFPDPVPVLMVGDQKVTLAPPLAWYQWVWSAFPLVLILLGGMIGGLLGAVATSINVNLMRSEMNGVVKYVLSALTSLVAIVLWIVIVAMLRR